MMPTYRSGAPAELGDVVRNGKSNITRVVVTVTDKQVGTFRLSDQHLVDPYVELPLGHVVLISKQPAVATNDPLAVAYGLRVVPDQPVPITISRTLLRGRPGSGFPGSWLYEATGPGGKKFDNRSVVELRRVLRKCYANTELRQGWEGRARPVRWSDLNAH